LSLTNALNLKVFRQEITPKNVATQLQFFSDRKQRGHYYFPEMDRTDLFHIFTKLSATYPKNRDEFEQKITKETKRTSFRLKPTPPAGEKMTETRALSILCFVTFVSFCSNPLFLSRLIHQNLVAVA
jgi:hypothetical protein